MKKPIMLDFYGVPGSGKTTIAHELAIQLKNEGWNISEPTFEWGAGSSRVKRILMKPIKAIIYYFHNKQFIDGLFKTLPYDKYTNKKDKIFDYINICSKFQTIENKDNVDIIVADEGFAQMGISFYTNIDLADKLYNTIEYIKQYYSYQIKFIHIDIDKSEWEYRINSRKNGRSLFEKSDLPMEMKIKLYDDILNKCSLVSSNYDSLDVKNMSVDKSVAYINKYIQQYKENL